MQDYLVADRMGTAKAEHMNTALILTAMATSLPNWKLLRLAFLNWEQTQASLPWFTLTWLLYMLMVRVYVINGVDFKLLPSSSKTKSVEQETIYKPTVSYQPKDMLLMLFVDFLLKKTLNFRVCKKKSTININSISSG